MHMQGSSAPLATLNAHNLSILEQTIARTAAPGPFALPPPVRSILSAPQGLNDALDSLIISGRLLMSRYTLSGSSGRYINERSLVQCGTDTVSVAAAAVRGGAGQGEGPEQLQVRDFECARFVFSLAFVILPL